MNVRNSLEAVKDIKPFLKPYESINDERFSWLTGTFIPYFEKWKKSINDRPGEFTPTAKAKIFISWQTYEALQITTFFNHRSGEIFT